MSIFRNRSLRDKLALVPLAMFFALLPVAIVRTGQSPEPRQERSKQGVPTLTEVLPTATQSPKAPVRPRTRTPIRVAENTSIGKVPCAKIKPQGCTQDDGYGSCPAFTHRHPVMGTGGATGGDANPTPPVVLMGSVMDGLCHRDDDDSPIKERTKLPKAQFKPDPKRVWL